MSIATYGQLVNGKRICLFDFITEVSFAYLQINGKVITEKLRSTIKSLYHRGYSVDDAVSYLIMKS